MMTIRNATQDDLEEIAKIELECFPVSEAATKDEFRERLNYYPNHFWLLFEDEKLVAFINGFVSDEENLNDEMYENATLHNEKGKWQMIFGLNTIPPKRNRGHGGKLIKKVIETAKKEKRLGVVLTCKESLVPYYSRFGFEDEGISQSKHGGAQWNQMRLRFHG